jgi:hypothetical protein
MCRGCLERHVGCHINCSDYNAEKILNKISHFKKEKEKQSKRLYWDYIFQKNKNSCNKIVNTQKLKW